MLRNLFALVVYCLLLFGSPRQTEGRSLSKSRNTTASPFLSRHVFLTINALSGKDTDGSLKDRKLEVNWQNFNDFVSQSDWIGLFNHNPATSYNTNSTSSGTVKEITPLEKFPVPTSTGVHKTNTRIEIITKDKISTQAGEENCVGFWVGYYRKVNNVDTLLTSNCLRVYPRWMNDLKDSIQNTPLHSLLIPGTHDAGAWQYYDGTVASDNIVAIYTYTQEETIYSQLLCGIRYLDVRVAYYPNTEEKFWVNHGSVKLYPLIDLLTDIKKFVSESQEVVFMDFHGFPVGFDSEAIHDMLHIFVNDAVGPLLAPKSLTKDVTLSQLWTAKKFIINTYNDGYNQKHEDLWPYLIHAWGEVNKVPDLENYLAGAMNTYGCKGSFWSSMAELTPTATDIITKPTYGLRGFAQDVNLPCTYWFQRDGWYSKANVISTDYFLGNNIIEMCIVGNQNRISCPSN